MSFLWKLGHGCRPLQQSSPVIQNWCNGQNFGAHCLDSAVRTGVMLRQCHTLLLLQVTSWSPPTGEGQDLIQIWRGETVRKRINSSGCVRGPWKCQCAFDGRCSLCSSRALAESSDVHSYTCGQAGRCSQSFWNLFPVQGSMSQGWCSADWEHLIIEIVGWVLFASKRW